MKCLLLLGLLACVLAVVCASSYNYAQAARGGRRSSSRRLSPARAAPAAEGGDEAEPAPEPYNFSYTSETDDGSKQERTETGDASGAVKGSYSYTDANGIFRTVTYWADQSGFHAEVSSNEPGLGTDENGNSPADVTLNLQPPPAGAYDAPAAAAPGRSAPRRSRKKSRNNYY